MDKDKLLEELSSQVEGVRQTAFWAGALFQTESVEGVGGIAGGYRVQVVQER